MPHRDLAGWTLGTYVAHNEALRIVEQQVMAERDRRYEELDRANKEAVRAALASAEKASDKTEASLKEYKIASNEWRDTVKDLVTRIPSRSEIDTAIKSVEERIAQQGKTFDATLKPVLEYIAADRGRGQGISTTWGILLGAAALVGSLIAIGTFVFRNAGAIDTLRTSQPPVIMVPQPATPTTPPR